MSKSQSDPVEIIVRLESIRKGIEASERLHHTMVREAIADACRVAESMKKTQALWRVFVAHPDWAHAQRRPKNVDRKNALQFVFRWLFGVTGESSKRASLYYRAASALIEEGVSPDEMSLAIEERGGVKKVASSSSTIARIARKRKQPAMAKKLRAPTNAISEPLKRVNPQKTFNRAVLSDNVRYTLIAEFEDGCFASFRQIPLGAPFRLDCELVDMADEAKVSVTSVELLSDLDRPVSDFGISEDRLD